MKKLLLALLILAATGPSIASAGPRFFPVDVYLDAGAAPLAAWQIELTYSEGLEIVGIEGGREPFGEAPYFDPKGLQSGRIVIAAFSIHGTAPAGPLRVATIHFMAEDGEVSYHARLVTAAGPDGTRIPARLVLEPSKGATP